MNSLQSSSHSFIPVPLSNGYYLPTNYKPLYGQRSDTDQLDVRLQTFIFWPTWAPATLNIDEMARSGLYYTGDGDKVRCFRCSFSFKNWKNGDDPKLVHQSVSPHCRNVLENDEISEEGEDFVDAWLPPSSVRQTSGKSNMSNQTRSYAANLSNRCSINEARYDESLTFSGRDDVPVITRDSEDSDCDSEDSDRLSDGADNLILLSREDSIERIRSNLETFEISRISTNVCKSEDLSNRKRQLLRTAGSQRRFNTNTKQRLKDENEKLRRAMTCRKCNGESSQTLFLPCRHLVTCERCADQMDECIVCQTKILGTVRIFMT